MGESRESENERGALTEKLPTALPKMTPLSENSTLPVVPSCTAAVSVTGCPRIEGFGETASVVDVARTIIVGSEAVLTMPPLVTVAWLMSVEGVSWPATFTVIVIKG